MEIILGYVDEDGDMFFVVFLRIANCGRGPVFGDM